MAKSQGKPVPASVPRPIFVPLTMPDGAEVWLNPSLVCHIYCHEQTFEGPVANTVVETVKSRLLVRERSSQVLDLLTGGMNHE